MHDTAHAVAREYLQDILGIIESKDTDTRYALVPAQQQRGLIHYIQLTLQSFNITQVTDQNG